MHTPTAPPRFRLEELPRAQGWMHGPRKMGDQNLPLKTTVARQEKIRRAGVDKVVGVGMRIFIRLLPPRWVSSSHGNKRMAF